MRATWVFLLAVGFVSADIGLGYRYHVPRTPFALPSYHFGENSGHISSLYNLGSGYQTGGVKSSSDIGTGFYQSSSSSSNILQQPINRYDSTADIGSAFQTQYSSSSQYEAADKYQQNYQYQQQPTQVFKHFYVHAAPEEPEEVKVRTPIVLPPAQKHYKIIFIQTPTENHRSQIQVPIQPQNEEKTIVYVLVKKPEDQTEVVIPKIEQKPPSKPEVFFIKYKNKEDSQTVINNIVKDYNQGQQVTVLNSGLGETSFNSAASTGEGASSAGASGESTFSSSSSFGNVQYDTPLYNLGHSHTHSHNHGNEDFGPIGTQGASFGVSSTTSGADLSGGLIASSIAPAVTVSTTASSVDFDSASAISTSQGVPYETYGPPKFRLN